MGQLTYEIVLKKLILDVTSQTNTFKPVESKFFGIIPIAKKYEKILLKTKK